MGLQEAGEGVGGGIARRTHQMAGKRTCRFGKAEPAMDSKEKMTKSEIIRIANACVLKKPVFPIEKGAVDFPEFIKHLERHLIIRHTRNDLLLPNLHEHIKTIAVFSDYGGESSDSQYFTYSFLFAGYDALFHSLKKMREIRIQHNLLTPFKEFCFKDMGYGPLNRALPSWLKEAGESIPGLLFTLIIPKSIKSIFGGDDKTIVGILEAEGYGKWKAPIAEKLLRVVHIISYFVALLSKRDQNIFWMTDDDAIIANDRKAGEVKRLFGRVIHMYAPHDYGKILIGKDFGKENDDAGISDLLSYPDLVAGSTESYYSRCLDDEEGTVKDTTNTVLLWLCHQGIALKKLNMAFKHESDGGISAGVAEWRRKDETPNNVEYIPIWL